MKKQLLYILVVLGFFFEKSAKASHFMGGSITYELISSVPNPAGGALKRIFRIKLVIYRDCGSFTNFAATEIVDFSPAVTSGTGTVATLTLNQISVKDVTPLCPGQVSKCSAGSTVTYGVQEMSYQADIEIDVSVPHLPVTISYSNCCRNSIITNGGNDQNWYISSYLDPNYDNSSPSFTLTPVFYHSRCEPFTFNPGAVDVDGDSLTFDMADCLVSAGSPVSYKTGFNGKNPLSTSCPVKFDKSTGSLSMVPSKSEIAISAYKILEYRNGVKIGEITRDIQIRIMSVTNIYPEFKGVSCTSGEKTCNGTTPLSCDTIVCPGTPVNITVESEDPDSNNLSMNAYSLPSGASWTSVSTGKAYNSKGIFSWTPDSSHMGTTYFITIKAEDDGCLIRGQSVFTYKVTVSNCAAVPLQLLSFLGERRAEGNFLSWRTGPESNIRFFDIERSGDGYDYTRLERIAGRDSDNGTEYSYTDKDANTLPVYYYRLRQVDINGEFNYSRVIILNTPALQSFQIIKGIPNPASGSMNLQVFSPNDGKLYLEVTDVLGRKRNSLSLDCQKGMNELPLDISSLESNLYYVIIKNERGETGKLKIIKN